MPACIVIVALLVLAVLVGIVLVKKSAEAADGDPAVFSFQWLRSNELNELSRAILIAKAESLRPGHGKAGSDVVPGVHSTIVDQPLPNAFLQQVRETLHGRENVQIVYVSAHGKNGQVLFGQDGSASFPYAELGSALLNGLNATDAVTAVFGMCEAGGADEQTLLACLPDAIDEVYAFTGKPSPNDVAAFLAGILIDEMRLAEHLKQQNRAVFGGGVREPDIPNAIAALDAGFDRILNAHAPEPEHNVEGGGGRFVRHYCRDEDTHAWILKEALSVPGRIAEPAAPLGA